MMRKRAGGASARDGVVLLVVISLLVLFSLVGLAFVVYAEGQANVARLWREAETTQLPDMDPELLLSYFLGQMIYDTDNPHSALRGHGLARNMYGRPGSTVPFNGTGRLHTGGGNDDYYNIDYTQYGGAARNPDEYGSPNPPYTYPDFNHAYLAAVRGSDGAVLVPSYYRTGPAGPVSLRPNPAYHTAFPPQDHPSGDVRNVAEGLGYNGGPNDSIWIDAGFPVMTGPDGRRFKPLFAPHIQDLDGRLNLNVIGNLIGWSLGGEGTSTYSISHQGMVRGEGTFERLFSSGAKNPEVLALFKGANGIPGRYDPNEWQNASYALAPQYTANSHYYSPTNQDCWPDSPGYENFFLPHITAIPGTGKGSFDDGALNVNAADHQWRLGWAPRVEHAYSNGWITTYDKQLNPVLYNFFDPSITTMHINGVRRNIRDRRFDPFNMESMYRYGDTGSPTAWSDLFVLCPNAFGNPTTGPRTRRLSTLLSMDTVTPGVVPCYTNPGGQSTFTTAGNAFPSTPPIPFPAPGPAPGGEFSPAWQAVSAGVGRLNLNQPYTNEFPVLNAAGGTCFNFTAAATLTQYQRATQERVNMCREVFQRFQAATGATDPNALRSLAQLSVNIVDFCQYMPIGKHSNPTGGGFVPDDVMTAFDWTGNGDYVFGTVLPRLVVNEAYVEVARTNPAMPNAARKVNFWVELHNAYISNGGRGNGRPHHHPAIPHSESGKARLWVNYPANQGYAAYRLQLADAAGNSTAIGSVTNSTGTPQGTRKTIQTFTPATTTQPLVLSGDDLNLVHTADSPDAGYDPTQVHAQAPSEVPIRNCSWGRNRGWYVLGPPTPFPGTDDANTFQKFFATLPHQDMSLDNGNVGDKYTIVLQRLACPYLPPQEDKAQIAARGYYNPYVTVDWMDQVEAQDGNGGQQAGQPDPRQSIGRNQPFAAHVDSQVKQTPQTALANLGMPKHSFFFRNTQKADSPDPVFAYDYVFWLNRQLLNTLELLHVSGYKPSELTQRFMLGQPDPNTGKPPPTGRFAYRAPWFESDKLIYRALEFFEGYLRNQWTPPGGRDAGRVNLNTVWDYQILQGLADRHGTHYYTDAGVQAAFQRMLQSRTPGGVPGPNDKPFMSYAAAYTPPGVQFPQGMDINDTLLREAPDLDANEQMLPPAARRRLFFPKFTSPTIPNPPELKRHAVKESGNDPLEPPHPYLWDELLRRIGDHVTTRSNVFAVWLTVGFFEVLNDGVGGGPPQLGPEIGRAENRQKRHRMFAIVDRTRVTIALDPATRQVIPGRPGQRPFFIDSLSSVTGSGAAETVRVAVLDGKYEDVSWSIQPGQQLVVGTGSSQEIVTVASTPNASSFTAVFTKPHVVGFAISNGLLGNPGPQPRFEVRHPDYQSVVRYFSIIE